MQVEAAHIVVSFLFTLLWAYLAMVAIEEYNKGAFVLFFIIGLVCAALTVTFLYNFDW